MPHNTPEKRWEYDHRPEVVERRKMRNREYYRRNPQYFIERSSEYQRRNAKVVRERHRRWERLRKYGVDDQWVKCQTEMQGNRCAACEREFVKTPHVDHNHKTGRARGLLCARCNVAVGVIESELYPKLLTYLEKYEGSFDD